MESRVSLLLITFSECRNWLSYFFRPGRILNVRTDVLQTNFWDCGFDLTSLNMIASMSGSCKFGYLNNALAEANFIMCLIGAVLKMRNDHARPESAQYISPKKNSWVQGNNSMRVILSRTIRNERRIVRSGCSALG